MTWRVCDNSRCDANGWRDACGQDQSASRGAAVRLLPGAPLDPGGPAGAPWTVANVSGLPLEAIEALTLALKGVTLVPAGEAFEIVRARKHGNVEAVLSAASRLGVARLLDREPSRERDLCLAMIAGRVLRGGSKLACTRQLHACTLGEELGVEGAVHDDLYAAMDWLLERQDRVEGRLARRHLRQGELALYDVSCSYFEGRTCPLARFGYDHGAGKRGRMQVESRLLCDSEGRPVVIEAFEGSLKDAKTLPSQVQKLEQRFGLSRVIVVTDRGIGTKENVTLLSDTAEFAFITALKAPQVRKLVKDGALQLSVFDELNLAEIEAGSIPFTILRATQFFEFLPQIVEAGAEGDSVRLSPGLIQFVAADDVAATVAELAIGAPVGERVELGGPEALGIDAWARRLFAATGDNRVVIADPHARYSARSSTAAS